MHILSHLSYPYLVANGVALAMGKTIPPKYNILILLFSVFPDIDQVYDFFKQLFKTGKYIVPATHHEVLTHWPIIYTPLIAIAVATLDPFFIIAASAIYIHLAMDSFLCNQGVMWLYPFSNKWFNYFSSATRKKNGLDWNKAYSKLTIASIDKIAFVLLLIHTTAFIII
jgi:hypothetical protein